MVYRSEVNFDGFYFVHFNRLFFKIDWTIIRRVLIRARQQFGLQSEDVNISNPDMRVIEVRISFSLLKKANVIT